MIDNGELFLRAPARKQGARLLGAGAQRGYLVLAPAGEMPLTARQIGPIFQSQRIYIYWRSAGADFKTCSPRVRCLMLKSEQTTVAPRSITFILYICICWTAACMGARLGKQTCCKTLLAHFHFQ